MQASLLSSKWLSQSADSILLRDSARGHIIYSTILVCIIVALALLPVLSVEVSTQSGGIIRPTTEKIEVNMLVSGTVNRVFAKENQVLLKDQLIFSLDDSVINEKMSIIDYQITEKDAFGYDLNLMILSLKEQDKLLEPLKTSHYKNEYAYFSNQLTEIDRQYKKSRKEAKRFRMLHSENLASLSDLEYKELELEQVYIKRALLIESQLERWNKDLLSNQLKLRELSYQQGQLEMEKQLYMIRSPIDGTLEQFSGITEGSYLQVGQQVVVISPDSDLVAEIYVSPHDIGYITEGMEVKIQVDAFNHNQWGLVGGAVKEVSSDFFMIGENNPAFRVKCSLDNTFLQLKNGYKGQIKKGMTIRARFLLGERTLLQLLYQNMDDWLNPLTE